MGVGKTAVVCGGRDLTFTPTEPWGLALYDALTRMRITRVIHGGAPGADRHAAAVAHDMGREVVCVPADWIKHGRKAGPMRNAEMLDMKPNVVIALPGGRGTADMCRQARAAGVRVVRLVDASTSKWVK